MDEADEFCVGKGYDGAADKLTRQELDDLHTQWKGRSDAFEYICISFDFIFMVSRNRLAIRGQAWICVCLETYVMIVFHDVAQIINLLLNPIVAYTNVGGGHCANDCVFRWCDGPCSKLTVPGDSNSFSYFDDIPTTGNLWGKRDHMEKIIMAQFRYDTGE